MARKSTTHLVAVVTLLFLAEVLGQQYVTVNTPSGPLRGQFRTSYSGKSTLFSFQGIPYAEPPVGELRFQPPVRKAPWTDVRDAVEPASICPQLYNPTPGNEDCLYLNVYGPDTALQNATLKTVMVWIHGGCFYGGTGSSTTPDYFVDEDVVIVSINYRLGLLGFLSTGDELVPGNMGLKDQAEALRWVQRNIASFGGDPDRVTIFGQSAGGASVHYHVLSPLSKGLFRHAIAISGSALNPWAFSKNATDRAMRFAANLGYSAKNTKDLVDFLRTLDSQTLVENIYDALSDEDRGSIFSCVWAPSVEPEHESAVLTEEPWVLVAEGRYNRVPYMSGNTDLEELAHTQAGGSLSTAEQVKNLNENFEQIVACDIRLPTRQEQLDGAHAVKLFYYNGSDITLQNNYTTALFDSHLFFAEGVDTVIRSMAQYSSEPVYYYQFAYNGPLSQFPGAPGAAHSDDVIYMFSPGVLDPDSDGAIIGYQMTAMWANFAKYGNPTPALDSLLTLNWTTYSASSPSYLKITAPLSLESNLFEPYMTFWHGLLP